MRSSDNWRERRVKSPQRPISRRTIEAEKTPQQPSQTFLAVVKNEQRRFWGKTANQRKKKKAALRQEDLKLLQIRGLQMITKQDIVEMRQLPELTMRQSEYIEKNFAKIKKLSRDGTPLLNSPGFRQNNWLYRNKSSLKERQQNPAQVRTLYVEKSQPITTDNLIEQKFRIRKSNLLKEIERQTALEQSIRGKKRRGIASVSDPTERKHSLLDIDKTRQSSELEDSTKLYNIKQMSFVVSLSNEYFCRNPCDQPYKAYICQANNGLLVKNILKRRPWWTFVGKNEITSCNLAWTSWKKIKVMEKLRPFQKRPAKMQLIDRVPAQTSQKSMRQGNLNKLLHPIRYHKILPYVRPDTLDGSHLTVWRKITDYRLDETCKQFCYEPNAMKLQERPHEQVTANHLSGMRHLHSKRLLYQNLKAYCQKNGKNILNYVPQTFVIQKTTDSSFNDFLQAYQKNRTTSKNLWICKPGQNSNRGHGIQLAETVSQVFDYVKNRSGQGRRSTTIIQKYMQKPMLFWARKFDIRCYLLITTVNGGTKAYWYDQGYIRTSSRNFTLGDICNRMVHLTNDAVQKKSQQYGKFQKCNKVSFAQFEQYLQKQHASKNYSLNKAYQEMKEISKDLVKAVYSKLNINNLQFSFELFGLDFMLDEDFKPYLIEANSNPCLETSGPLLTVLLTKMIDNVISIAIDPLFPPPTSFVQRGKRLTLQTNLMNNKYQLIFDENCEKMGRPISSNVQRETPQPIDMTNSEVSDEQL